RAVEPGEPAAGFVHQKVGGCKVPVIGAWACEGSIDAAGGDQRETVGERWNMRLERRAEALDGLGPEPPARTREARAGEGALIRRLELDLANPGPGAFRRRIE